jgi:formylglycine-generating enzyme required for sulfatase activity
MNRNRFLPIIACLLVLLVVQLGCGKTLPKIPEPTQESILPSPVEKPTEPPTEMPASPPTEEPPAKESPEVVPTSPKDTPAPPEPYATPINPGSGSVWDWSDGSQMVYIPAGEFTMGISLFTLESLMQRCPGCTRDWYLNETPDHPVYLDGYWIDRIEVSNAHYQNCVLAMQCTEPEHLDAYFTDRYFYDIEYNEHPVIYVSWEQAQNYCLWAGKRLPTEAEWEKAARGIDGRLSPWGSFSTINCTLANYDDCNQPLADVDSYPAGASPYGALNMAGNVREWVFDWYSADYYERSPTSNPLGPDAGERHTVRGGSYLNIAMLVRATSRDSGPPDPDGALGFRCAIAAK